MQNLEKRIAALETAQAAGRKNVKLIFRTEGETDEQLRARCMAEGGAHEHSILVSFEPPKVKTQAGMLSADAAVQARR